VLIIRHWGAEVLFFAAVWAVVAVVVLVGVQGAVDGVQGQFMPVLAVELLAQCAVCAFHMGVVFGVLGRQHELSAGTWV